MLSSRSIRFNPSIWRSPLGGDQGPTGLFASLGEQKAPWAWVLMSAFDPFLPLAGWPVLLLDQAHASQPGFRLLKLRNINFDQVKPTPTEHFGRSRIAGGKDQTTADAQAVGGSWLALMNGQGVDRHELRGIDASRMIKQDGNASSIKAGKCRTGLQVQAPSQLRPNNVEANSSGDCA